MRRATAGRFLCRFVCIFVGIYLVAALAEAKYSILFHHRVILGAIAALCIAAFVMMESAP